MLRSIRPSLMLALLASVSTLAASSADAANVKISEQRCVPSAPRKIHDSIVNYSGYVSLPGAEYKKSVGSVGTLRLLRMSKSQAVFYANQPDKTDAIVLTELQPTNLQNGKVYPRFLLRCTSSWNGGSQFTQSCQMLKDKPHFALDGFVSKLEVHGNDSTCEAGESRLVFSAVMETNSADIDALKAEVLAPFGVLGSIVSKLFDEELFMKSYYENFYDGWVKSLTQ